MHTNKSVLFVIFLVIFQVKAVQSQGQDIELDKLIHHPWVDSVFESLSITERINQILTLEVGENILDSSSYSTAFGGIVLKSKGPVSHGNLVNAVQRKLKVPALVFSSLDESYGIRMDSVIRFASPLVLSAISEPHLLYETGQAIARQCNLLGIHGLIPVKEDMLQKESPSVAWRLTEINQGFSNQGILPLNYMKFIHFKDINLNSLKETKGPVMMVIEPENVSDFHESMRDAITGEQILLDELDKKCKYILALKLWVGLNKRQEINTSQLNEELNLYEYQLLKHELAEASITVIKNDGLLPVSQLENKKIASLTIGKTNNPVFEEYLENYTQVDHYQVDYYDSDKVYTELWSKLSSYDLVIVGLYESEFLKVKLNGRESFVIFQEWLNQSGKCITGYFGDPNLLNNNHAILNASTLILTYEDSDLYNSLVPQLIFGGTEADGSLPVTINETYKKGHGIQVSNLGRFSYTFPEAAGLDSEHLKKIDSIVYMAIKEKAIPGCEVLVVRNSKVVFKKAYGYHTYDSLLEVTNTDLYDLASVTKVSGALPGLMKLYEEGKFDLNASIGTYLPYFKRGNKKELTFREILAHQSGIKPYIVYWKTAIKKSGKYRRKTLSITQSDDYPYKISNNLYLHKDYKEKIYKQIKKSKVGEKKYLYSGLTFYLFPEIIEAITGENYTDYIYANFYKPLGSTTLTYNPLEKYDSVRIVPTEYDSLFRKSLIHGKVHDEGADMMMGVSSNAGLFANANDLAKLFQMYCNYGTFGGREYLNEESVREFTRGQYLENENRRGLGFDRPVPEPHEDGNTAKSVSQLSFGHSGFTGTFVWADPEYNLVYVFLSNRVYTTRNNRKLYEMNVRTNIQEVIYEAME